MIALALVVAILLLALPTGAACPLSASAERLAHRVPR